MALMYTPHPDQSRLPAFVPPSLVRAAEKDFAVKFSELLEMRRVIEARWHPTCKPLSRT